MGKVHKTTITHLEMRAEPRLPPVPKPQGKYALVRAEKPPVHFYRYLYNTVGRDYAWVSRKKLTDAELIAIIHNDDVEIYVLWLNGSPVGFTEIDFRMMPDADLCFLGVMPEFIGMGIGRYLLCAAIGLAWSRGPERLTVQTCTLDHPNALRLYQRHGFTPYAQSEAMFEE
ncbi:MAG: GNAT family N-acetyltransferase [Parvibaculum sp.]|uniref:GNAT family N-acetyltransferase n=1 Tax=Parvibaculum sp. TaxID=2024848 RepID=UPI003C7781F3